MASGSAITSDHLWAGAVGCRQMMANRGTSSPGSPLRWRCCLVRLAVVPLREICAGFYRPQLPHPHPLFLPSAFHPSLQSPSYLSPETLRREDGASQHGKQEGGLSVCIRVCLQTCPKQLSDPREAPVTWCQSYLGNWPFWYRVN